LVGKSEGKLLPEKPRLRRGIDIKIDLKEIGWGLRRV
jgi:hypothetical protein